MKPWLVPFFILSFLFPCISHAEGEDPVKPEWEIPDIISMISTMEDTELLGQVFLLGYMGHTPSGEILAWIREKKIGGIKIFGWNASHLDSLARSIAAMQIEAGKTRLGIPLFIATDQEGGWVRHIKGETSITPGALSIGATSLPYDAYTTGYHIGRELRTLGINMNFAPTVDLYINPNTHVIGPRSFSSDPVKVGVLGQAFFKGLEENGIIATAKHFPGHGNADEDSHGTLPVITDSLDILREREFIPYRFLIREGIPAVMSGHLAFPAITGNDDPASLSRILLTDILRKELSFDGLIITDDLQMHGAQKSSKSFAQICEKAIRAGNTILMISRNETDKQTAWNHLLQLLKKDSAFRQTVNESVRRIILSKRRYLGSNSGFPLIPSEKLIEEQIPSGTDFFTQQAFRSITLIRNRQIPLLPSRVEAENLSVLLAGQFGAFLNEGKKRYKDAESFSFSYSPFYSFRKEEKERLVSLSSRSDVIIFCLATPGGLEMLQILEPYAEKIIVMSTLTPVYLAEVPWVRSAIAVYGTGTDSFDAGFAALSGEYIPPGKLPMHFPGLE